MSSYILWIFLLAIWNVVLFYGSKFGISVSLFILPMLMFIYYFLKKNNKINNKKGLIYMIPIFLLSLTYGVFDNELFKVLNFIAIIILFGVLYVTTIKPVNNLVELIDKSISLLIMPFSYIGNFFRVSTSKIREKIKISDKTKKVLKSLLIVIPVTLVIVGLLSEADMIFDSIFGKIFNTIIDFINEYLLDNLLGRLITFTIVFFAIGVTMMYLLYEFSKKDEKTVIKEKKVKDVFTIKILVSVLNIVYIIFDIIQVKSLMLHSVSSNINYAEYARQGFFELMLVSIINITIILISKKFEVKENEKDYKFINIMNVLMVFLTIIIIVSSFLRMNLYESAFGYTTLRLFVYIILMTETILMIPTVMYIFNSNFDILKSYIHIILFAYLVTNFMNIDYMVARRNVDRYYIDEEIDLEYLKNNEKDNIPVLIELYNKTTDHEMKDDLEEYFNEMYSHNVKENIFEFNISRYKADILLEDFK